MHPEHVLSQGEIGIELLGNGKVKMKVGDGVTEWGSLPYFGGEENKVYVGELDTNETADAAIKRLVGEADVNGGDMAIIKKAIANDKYEYTAYVYVGSAWQAMDGNYDAENVYFAKDLTITANVGVQTVGSSGSKTLDTTGKNLKQVMDMLFAAEKDPTATAPGVGVTLSSAGAKEVGTEFAPTYSATLSAGSYTYGPATGITAKTWAITDSNGKTASTASGTFDSFTVEDETSYKITATATYDAGAVPVTNLGNPCPAKQIAAGSKSNTSSAVTGFRKMFAGSKTTQDATLTSALIRAMSENSRAAGAVTDWAVEVVEGATQVVVAVPDGYAVTAVKDTGAFGTDIVASFIKQTVAVEGLNGYKAKNYNVYVYKPETALGANTYKVTVR